MSTKQFNGGSRAVVCQGCFRWSAPKVITGSDESGKHQNQIAKLRSGQTGSLFLIPLISARSSSQRLSPDCQNRKTQIESASNTFCVKEILLKWCLYYKQMDVAKHFGSTAVGYVLLYLWMFFIADTFLDSLWEQCVKFSFGELHDMSFVLYTVCVSSP